MSLLQQRSSVTADISEPLQPFVRPPNPIVAELSQESTREPRVLKELSEVSAELLNATATALSQARDISGSEWYDGQESEQEEVAKLGRPVMDPSGILLQGFAGGYGNRWYDGRHRTVSKRVALQALYDSLSNGVDEARSACDHLLTGHAVAGGGAL